MVYKVQKRKNFYYTVRYRLVNARKVQSGGKRYRQAGKGILLKYMQKSVEVQNSVVSLKDAGKRQQGVKP